MAHWTGTYLGIMKKQWKNFPAPLTYQIMPFVNCWSNDFDVSLYQTNFSYYMKLVLRNNQTKNVIFTLSITLIVFQTNSNGCFGNSIKNKIVKNLLIVLSQYSS